VYKKQHRLTPVDSSREADQLARISELAERSGLDPDFARRMLQLIIDEVVENHKKLIAS
jgi:chorismate mutase